MASTLGAMIGSDHRVALAILSRNQTATSKSQMIGAIGKASLDARLLPLLQDLLRSFDGLAKRRNKVVHGLWGTSEVEPHGLIWLPPDAQHRITLGLTSRMASGNPLAHINEVLADAELWEIADFDELIQALEQLASASALFAARMQMLASMTANGIDTQTMIDRIQKEGLVRMSQASG